MKFKMTDEAQKIALNVLAKDGLLAMKFERVGKNTFTVGLYNENVEIMEFPTFELHAGNTFELHGMKFELDFNDPAYN